MPWGGTLVCKSNASTEDHNREEEEYENNEDNEYPLKEA